MPVQNLLYLHCDKVKYSVILCLLIIGFTLDVKIKFAVPLFIKKSTNLGDRNIESSKEKMISVEQCVLALMLAVLSSFSTGVSCLQCYQCLINPPPGQYYNTTKNLCVHFDYSDKFIVDCPYSTMCMKQDFHLELGGAKIKSVLRDCASQKNEYHDYSNGKWFPKMEILEPYEEGCQTVDDKGERTTSYNRFCYCRKNLCNASPSTNHEGYTDIMGVIVVFNLMKYINSLR